MMGDNRISIEWTITEAQIEECLQFGESETLLAHLILNDVVFLNSFWMEKTWPAEAQRAFNVFVGCSDTFYYACADAERLPYSDLAVLYRMWRRNSAWGPTAWCVAKRKARPIDRVCKCLVAQGYDLEALLRGELPSSSKGETE